MLTLVDDPCDDLFLFPIHPQRCLSLSIPTLVNQAFFLLFLGFFRERWIASSLTRPVQQTLQRCASRLADICQKFSYSAPIRISGHQNADNAGPSRPLTSNRAATGSNGKHRSREKKRSTNIAEGERENQRDRERIRERERHRHRNGPYDSPKDRVKARRRRSPSVSSSSSSSPEDSPSPRPRSLSRPKHGNATPVLPSERNYKRQGASAQQ